MTRSSRPRNTGNAGMHYVMAAFNDIGWGPASNAENDEGTDLFVQASDESGDLLRCVVGVQVKAGPSYFKQPGDEDGEPGWWYYESEPDHFDDWVNYNVPHLVVLHDLETHTSYWVHVTSSAVRWTGQGRKILVPASQTIDDENAVALREVALSQNVPLSFEGTVLGPPPGTVPLECELRYALIAPRLVAPHPNFDPERPMSAAAGVALVAQGRFRGLKTRADRHPDVPDPDDPDTASDWTWRFVAAIWGWALRDSIASLQAVLESAPDSKSAAASGVFVACALARVERHRDAIAVLTPLVEDDRMDPVDRAWVLVQRARASSEVGDLQSCHADALAARDLLAGHSDDVTASAITAAVEWHLSISGSAEDRDYRPTAVASDTTVSWWRSQQAGWGLASAVDLGFRQWAQELSVSIAGIQDHGAMELFGAELCADLVGEHAAWKRFASLGARLRIQHAIESSDMKAELIEGLDALRRSGDAKSLRLAIEPLLWEGPIDTAASAVSRVHPAEWTRTTVTTNFAVLETAGHLLGENAAAEMLAWVSHIAGDGIAEFIDRYQPTMHVIFAAYKAMAGLIPAAAHTAHSNIARFVATQRTDLPDVLARQLTRQLDWLDPNSVSDAGRAVLRKTAFGDQSYINTRILGWLAANDDTEALARLKAQAVEGDLEALAEIADVQLLHDAEAAALISLLDERAQRVLSEMRDGRHDAGSIDTLDALTLLNLQFPNAARWPVVHEVLREPLALADQKSTMCVRISALADRLPASERELLVADLDSIATAAEGFWPGTEMAGVDIVLAVALDAVDAHEANAAVIRLALGSEPQRTNAAKLLGLGRCPEMRPVLTQLIRDPHPPVRHEAARNVGKLIARAPDALLAALARDVAHSNGMHLPGALLAGLALDSPELNPTSGELATHLQRHPSALIRYQAKRRLQS